MAEKVTCPYCDRESDGPDILQNLKDGLESFYAWASLGPVAGPRVPLRNMGKTWVIVKCSNPNCGEKFYFNKETQETTRR